MSSTSTTLSSVLSALGGSNGIDVTSAVDSILYADRAPERTWQAEQTTLASQTTAINQLNTDASTLSDQLSALQDVGSVLNSVSATSSDSSVVTATAADGTSIGNHTVTVNSLATTASWYSQEEVSSSTPLASGSFAITSGGSTTTIQIGNGNNTLAELASSINNQSLGVTASVVTDSNGARLSLVANSSGGAANFSVSQTSGFSFTQSQVGANASLTVDGVPISSASNTVTGALSGITLNLQSASPNETVNLTLAPDSTDITTAVTNFVSAYNALIADVSNDIAYNSTTSTAGPLQADSAAQSFYSDLLSSTNYNSGSSTLNTLDALGITTNTNGTLSFNPGTLATALQSNPAAVASFFQGSSGEGFAASLTNTLNTYTDPSNGAFTVDLSSISAENEDLTQQTDTLETYLSSQQTILTTEYNNADIAIQQLPQQIKNTDALLGMNQNSNNN